MNEESTKEPIKPICTYSTNDKDGSCIDTDKRSFMSKDVVHVKTGNVYTVTEFIWDADTDQWSVLYRRKDQQGVRFKRLWKNFLFKEDGSPRFVALNYGNTITQRNLEACCGENR